MEVLEITEPAAIMQKKQKKKARQKTEREPAFVDGVSDAAVIGQGEASLVRC